MKISLITLFVSFVLGAPVEVANEMFPSYLNVFLTYLFSGALLSGTTMLIHTLYVHLQGDKWNDFQELERKRQIKKGVIGENEE